MKNSENNTESGALRQKAETLLKEKSTKEGLPLSDSDNAKLIHELEVSRIELELQNEELRHALEEARVANDRYTELFDQSPIGFITLSPDGRILEVNIPAAALLGKERTKLLSRRLGFFVSEEERPDFNRLLDNIFKTKTIHTCEIVLLTGNESFPRNVRFSGIRNGNDKQCRMVMEDITDRKLAREKLIKSERNLSEAERIGKTGSWDYNVVTDIAIGSENMFRIFDVDPEIPTELAFKYFVENLVHPDDREYILSVFADAINGIRPYDVEYRVINKDGNIRVIHALAETVRDEHGKATRMIGRVEDVTEKKRFENVYKFLITEGYPGSGDNFFESLAKYLSEILGAEYICIDKLEGDGLTAHTVAVYNEGKFDPNVSYTLKQTPCGDVVGKTICCFPDNVCQLFPHDEALQELKAQSYIGTTLWSFDGKPIGLIAVISHKPMNNTVFAEEVLKLVAIRAAGELERNLVEDKLRLAKEKAEEGDRLKSAFLANMSHEIRTPMNGILGFAGFLKETDLTGEEQQKYIRIIEKSGARLLNTINDIIDISKIESGQMEISVSSINVNEVIETFYEFFKPDSEMKGVQLSFKNSLPLKEAEILTDSHKFDGILTNLIRNAIKFTDKGTIEFGYTLTEKPQEVAPNSHPRGTFLRFFVKDTGVGIPVDKQDIIFERFMQADSFDRKALQGTGLGLAISKAYVEMLGGKIWVESTEGKGSIFYFTVPYKAGKRPQSNVGKVFLKEGLLLPVNNLKILIADDDDTSVLLITKILDNKNNEVLHANTGDQAIEYCRKNPDLDMVLMDIKMPGINGYEATRQIRQFNKGVVIIAQTAYGLRGDKERAIDAGCNDYISKPINREELLRLMSKYFNKQKF